MAHILTSDASTDREEMDQLGTTIHPQPHPHNRPHSSSETHATANVTVTTMFHSQLTKMHGTTLKVDDDSSSFGEEEAIFDEEQSHHNGMTESKDSTSTLEYRNVTLWQFLLELLVNKREPGIIQWTDREGEFMLLQPEQVARLWGMRKSKNSKMNYDKLSRALRYYYQKNIIQKVPGQKFMYRFVHLPESYRLNGHGITSSMTQQPQSLCQSQPPPQQAQQVQQQPLRAPAPAMKLSPTNSQHSSQTSNQISPTPLPHSSIKTQSSLNILANSSTENSRETVHNTFDEIKLEPREEHVFDRNTSVTSFLQGLKPQESFPMHPQGDYSELSSAAIAALPVLCSMAKRLAMNEIKTSCEKATFPDAPNLLLNSSSLSENNSFSTGEVQTKRHCATCRCCEVEELALTLSKSVPMNFSSTDSSTFNARTSLQPGLMESSHSSTDSLLLQRSQEILAQCLLGSTCSSGDTTSSSSAYVNCNRPLSQHSISNPSASEHSRKRPASWNFLDQLTQQLQSFREPIPLSPASSNSRNFTKLPHNDIPAVNPMDKVLSSNNLSQSQLPHSNLYFGGTSGSMANKELSSGNGSVSACLNPCQDQQSHLHALNMKQLSKAIMKYWSTGGQRTSMEDPQPPLQQGIPPSRTKRMNSSSNNLCFQPSRQHLQSQHLSPPLPGTEDAANFVNRLSNSSNLQSQQQQQSQMAAALCKVLSSSSERVSAPLGGQPSPTREDDRGVTQSSSPASNPLVALKEYLLQGVPLLPSLQQQLNDSFAMFQNQSAKSVPSPSCSTVQSLASVTTSSTSATVAPSSSQGQDLRNIKLSPDSPPFGREEPTSSSAETFSPQEGNSMDMQPKKQDDSTSSRVSSWPLSTLEGSNASCIWMPVPLQLASNLWQLMEHQTKDLSHSETCEVNEAVNAGLSSDNSTEPRSSHTK